MTAEVVALDDHRPHFVVHDPVSNQTHVLPVALVVKMIGGVIPVSEWDESASRALLRLLLEIVADG